MAEGFTCEVDRRYRSACKGLDFYGEHEGHRLCVLHSPSKEKKDYFRKVVESKLAESDYDFGGTIFPEGFSDFEGAEFDAPVSFYGATFLGDANFTGAQFSGEWTLFTGAQFSGMRTYFSEAQFNAKRTHFSEAQFSSVWTYFSRAQFNGEETDFSRARFNGEETWFSEAQFSGKRTHFSEAQFSSVWTLFTDAQFSGKRTHFTGAQFNSEGTEFTGAQFNGEETSFLDAQFSGKRTHFTGAQFSGEKTYFLEAQFSGEETLFTGAQFSGEKTFFSGAQFRGQETDFSRARFNGEETHFTGAQFRGQETFFLEATFIKEVNFRGATFWEKVDFWGSKENWVFTSESWLLFDSVRIEKPELLSFRNIPLHPGWFINTDVRKVDFSDVKWYGMPGGPEGTLDKEIDALTKRAIKSPHTLLSQACQRLSANAEENRDYPLANESYYWSMDARRKEGWRNVGPIRTLYWAPIRTLYWALSGYGVRARRALLWLLGIWAAFTIFYILVPSSPFSGFSVSDFGEAIVYSLGAIARLNPEPKPDPGWFQFLVTVEGLVGPLQIGLLLLAIRRQVMR